MKAFCIGRNFAEHAQELRNKLPKEPVVFIKNEDCFFDVTHARYKPNLSKDIHYEAELVLRFSSSVSVDYLNKSNVLTYVDAITVGLDFTDRTKQKSLKNEELPWEKAKSFHQSAIVGKWIPIEHYADKLLELSFQLSIDEKIVQTGYVHQMIFDIPTLIFHIAAYFPIKKGDLLFCGTPKGVGEIKEGNVIKGTLNDKCVLEFVY